MINWWNGLSLLSQIYYLVAIAGTLALLIQSILLFIGVGDNDGDMDTDGGDFDGMNLFTIRGIIAFVAVGGWTGVILSEFNVIAWLTIVLSIIAGTVALLVIALIMKSFYKMQANGNIDISKSTGKIATIYIRVYANGKTGGKVTLTFQGKFMELEAVTDNDKDYTVGENVLIVGTRGDSVIVSDMPKENNDNN